MKKKVLFLAVVLYSATYVFSQNQIEENNGYWNAFEADSAVWKFRFGSSSPAIINEYILYGDTLVDGKQWKIVTIKHYFFDSRGITGVKGLIRNEDKKVLFRAYPGCEEYLWEWAPENVLFDFSWEDGDYIDEYKDRIVVVDSIELNDKRNHKRIHFKFIYSSFDDDPYLHYSDLIEGLGSLMYDPFQRWFYAPIEIEPLSLFLCCHVNGKLLYRNSVFSDCNGTLVSNEKIVDITHKANVVFTDKQLRITFNNETLFDVELFNMQGMILLQSKNNRNEMLANLENLPKGVYIVKIYSGNFAYSEKIVK